MEIIDQRSMREEMRIIDPKDPTALLGFLHDAVRKAVPEATLLSAINSCSQPVRDEVIKIFLRSPFSTDNYPELWRMQILQMMNQQLSFALESTIQPRGFDLPLPTREAIMDTLGTELTHERAREILQFHEARLVLFPLASAERYEEEVSRASLVMEGAGSASINRFAADHLKSGQYVEIHNVKQWCFAITEGAQVFDLPGWDDDTKRLRQRVNLFDERFQKWNIQRLDHGSYACLMLQGLRKGRPIDLEYEEHSAAKEAKVVRRHRTLLHGVRERTCEIGEGGWLAYSRSVWLGSASIRSPREVGAEWRFRPAVKGCIEQPSSTS